MKYRTMMFDVASSDDTFGYIYSNTATGQIASVGTLCKIVDRQLLEDGRQYIAVEGVGRFRVTKIVKTLPYILAEVANVEDEPVDEAAADQLEKEVYSALKYYMRLMRSYGANSNMVVSPALKRNRYTSKSNEMNTQEKEARRTNFSFSLANMIQMTQSKESQLLLQTTSVLKRLQVEKEILTQAAKLVGDQLVEMEVLTETLRDGIKVTAYSGGGDDSDILPSEDKEGSGLDKEEDEWDMSTMQ